MFGKRTTVQVILVVFTWLSYSSHKAVVEAQECPLDWESFGDSCYSFVFHPVKTFDEAKTACQILSSALVSVDSSEKHTYISQWLTQRDPRRNNWYTSGEQDSAQRGTFWWSGKGTAVGTVDTYWNSQREQEAVGRALVYKYDGVNYGWGRTRPSDKLPYVCEIPRIEAHRIFQSRRDFFFGTDVNEAALLEKGPVFTVHPKDKIIIGSPDSAYIECVAFANPHPVYRWRKISGSLSTLIPPNHPRYTLTNGRLTISKPVEETEAAEYECEVENKFGKIISSPVRLSFGYLRQFSNVQRDAVRAMSYKGASVECGQPQSKPGLVYQWYKNDAQNFVRPSLQDYLFVSHNGKLYFSEITRVDQGSYYCVVQLKEEAVDSDTRHRSSPSGTSLPIPVLVAASPPLQWGPEFQDDFIAVFPQTPLRGERVRMECFAYGTGPLSYSWNRVDGKMPVGYLLKDHNRVLILPDVRLEDSGTYNCHVTRQGVASADKMIDLKIVAKPFFSIPIGNKHVDKGSQLTWRCEAKAIPSPTYTWFKNGAPLQTTTGQLEVDRNVLVIKTLDPKLHDGMYQCKASNIYGSSYSSGQLRVLLFKPLFKREPLPSSVTGALNGNITIRCRPEGSPYPSFQWSKNGGDLGLSPGADTGRIRLDVSGDLTITDIQPSDAGRYTCTATNSEGSASGTSEFSIIRGTTLFRKPGRTTVITNSTAFLYCQASHAAGIDLVYMWTFNGKQIDLKHDPHYGLGTGDNAGGLYIRNARLIHAGDYECQARTPLDMDSAQSSLLVKGPPSEMAGVYVDSLSITSYSMLLKWTVTTDNGEPILTFIIEALTQYNESWQLVAKDILYAETLLEKEDKSAFVVDGLKPNVGYSFRVLAVNNIGIGAPSQPSDEYYTPGAPPNVAPEMVGGGGGSEGLLTITWEPLAPIDAHGSVIGYLVYWRRPGAKISWSKAQVFGNTGQYVAFVGLDNFYLEYEVKIQAFNEYGRGPNSSVEIIFSAEGMPVGMLGGFDVGTVNSTAIDVGWDLLPETRESIKGKIRGYWINYWIEPSLNDMDEDAEVFMEYKPVYGQVGETTVIGLEPGTYYMFTIQVFNSAGLGPISEDEFEETDGPAPFRYPMEVAVHSDTATSVRVTFRGITTSIDEEPVRGYMLRYWAAGNTIRSAVDIDLEMETSGVISGLERDKMYELRVLAYSDGGFGKQSPSILFTLGGQVILDSTVTDLLATSTVQRANMVVIVTGLIAVLIAVGFGGSTTCR